MPHQIGHKANPDYYLRKEGQSLKEGISRELLLELRSGISHEIAFGYCEATYPVGQMSASLLRVSAAANSSYITTDRSLHVRKVASIALMQGCIDLMHAYSRTMKTRSATLQSLFDSMTV